MLLGARQFFQKNAAGWQNPYVTNGLVAMWDGIWNVGGGLEHDSNSHVWYDCVGGLPILFPCDSCNFASNGLSRSGTGPISGKSVGGVDYGFSFIEAVLTVDNFSGGSRPVVMSFGSSRVINLIQSPSAINVATTGKSWTFPSLDFSSLPLKFSVAAAYEGTSLDYKNCNRMWLNGGEDGAKDGPSDSWGSVKLHTDMMGTFYNGSDNYRFQGTYHAIRLYNRALTQSEIDANHALDVQRFGIS